MSCVVLQNTLLDKTLTVR